MREPLTMSLKVDDGDTFTQNFQNTEKWQDRILNIHRGMELKSGLINYGDISFENVTQWCFYSKIIQKVIRLQISLG
ncbi:MAG: hypothetical protein IPK25_15885 [Saprospiraceae bacterium]|nr:hypothetical protein [Saprospiraceae bacterium]